MSHRFARSVVDCVALFVALLVLTLAPLAHAAPNVSDEPSASVDYGEGLGGAKSPTANLVLVLDGGYLSSDFLAPLTLDPKTGVFFGAGLLDYHRAGVEFDHRPVSIVVTFFQPIVNYCSPVGRFVATVEAFDGTTRVLTADTPAVVDPPAACPSETLTARVGDVGGNLGRYKKLLTF